MSKKIFFETFLNKDDATYWLDTMIETEVTDEFHLEEVRFSYLNHAWSVSILISKKQGELDFIGGFDD